MKKYKMDNRTNGLSVLAIVPARGGSKGIKHKNIVRINKKPLIAYTLAAIKGTRNRLEHIVSTEDKTIADQARAYGGNVPYLRPVELAQDDTNIVVVVEDVLNRSAKSYDYLLLLQPTAPLRTAEDIDAALGIAEKERVNSVCSFMKVESYHPWYMYYWQKDNSLKQVVPTVVGKPRQEFPMTLWRNGAIYLVKTDYFLKEKKFVSDDCRPYIMPAERSVNIDSVDDLKLAEYYLKRVKRENNNVNKELKVKNI